MPGAARRREVLHFWGNLLGYQAVWFIAVIGAGHGWAWPGPISALVFVAWQLRLSDQVRSDAILVVAALAAGCVVDGVLAATGWAVHASPTPAVPGGGAPIWILSLWAAYAMTLNHSLASLRRHPWLACTLGTVAGPLVYWGAGRTWQALAFASPAWHGLLWLAVGWTGAMAVLIVLARRGMRGTGAGGAEGRIDAGDPS